MSETIRSALTAAAAALGNAGFEDALWEARYLLADSEDLTVTQMIAEPDRVLHNPQRYRDWVARRAKGEPASRISGFCDFHGLRFRVTPDVLDPRGDSETLVEAVLSRCPDDRPIRIADLGTGSGCLLLSVLSERPLIQGVGIDRSWGAARTARENAVTLGLSDRAVILCGSWSDTLCGCSLDILLSNPPYIRHAEIVALDRAVRDYDPPLALDGGADGLDCYRAIAAEGRRVLRPGGLLALEIGWDQGDSVSKLLSTHDYRDISVLQDLAGRDRVVLGWI